MVSLDNNTTSTKIYKLPVPLPDKFNDPISLNRSFASLDDFAARLQSLTSLRTKIINSPLASQSSMITIYQATGTVTDLLNQAAVKFNMTWTYEPADNYLVFSYNRPLIKANPVITGNTTAQIKSLAIDQQVRTWTIKKDDIELRTALARWCKDAGWQLDWQVQGKFPIDFKWEVQGTFKEAVNQVLKSTQHSEIPLSATMYVNNKVLRITSSGN